MNKNWSLFQLKKELMLNLISAIPPPSEKNDSEREAGLKLYLDSFLWQSDHSQDQDGEADIGGIGTHNTDKLPTYRVEPMRTLH